MTEQDPPLWSYHGQQANASSFVTMLIHLYRAEVSRANVWRTRLDTTTNWAVATVGAALTFSFSSAENPNFLLLLVLFLMLTFLYIEARRYRYYAMWYQRVNLLETDFIAATLVPPHEPSPDWGASLHKALTDPASPVSIWQAVGHRYRRNYIWLVTLLTGSWILKLMLHPSPTTALTEIIERASVGPLIPGTWVMSTVIAIYLALMILGIVTYLPRRPKTAQPGPIWGMQSFKRPSPESLALIITTHKEALATRLMHDLHRGVTAMSGIGMYTNEIRDVLLCALTEVQIPQMRQIIEEIDPGAFFIVSQGIRVQGRGFPHFEPPS